MSDHDLDSPLNSPASPSREMSKIAKSRATVWMPFYIGEYLSETTHFTAEQHGADLLLLITAWKRGARLPNDDLQLARITKLSMATWKRSKGVLLQNWEKDGDNLVHRRLLEKYEHTLHRYAVKLENGLKGGRPSSKTLIKSQMKPIGFANLNQTKTQSQSQRQKTRNKQSPAFNVTGITDEVETCLLMEEVGFYGATPQHPGLVAAISEGVPPRILLGCLVEARSSSSIIANPLLWAIAVARARYAEDSNMSSIGSRRAAVESVSPAHLNIVVDTHVEEDKKIHQAHMERLEAGCKAIDERAALEKI